MIKLNNTNDFMSVNEGLKHQILNEVNLKIPYNVEVEGNLEEEVSEETFFNEEEVDIDEL